MSSVADSTGNLTDCMKSSSDSAVMTAGSFSGTVNAGFPDLAAPSWRVLTNTSNSGSGMLQFAVWTMRFLSADLLHIAIADAMGLCQLTM